MVEPVVWCVQFRMLPQVLSLQFIDQTVGRRGKSPLFSAISIPIDRFRGSTPRNNVHSESLTSICLGLIPGTSFLVLKMIGLSEL